MSSVSVARLLLALLLVSASASVSAASYADQGAAYAQCKSHSESEKAMGRNVITDCVLQLYGDGGNAQYRCSYLTAQVLNCSGEGIYIFPENSSCANRANSTIAPVPIGTLICNTGCEYATTTNGSQVVNNGSSDTIATGNVCTNNKSCPEGYYKMPDSLGYQCAPRDPICPDTEEVVDGVCKKKEQCPQGMFTNGKGECEEKSNECPAGQVKSPDGSCLPGEGQCAAGEARGKDGTCKRDADGDGQPDEGEDEGTTDKTFAGGDNCSAPPSCSGDPIMCGQARIQWRIDCNTRKNRNISGGSCGSPPICTGEKCDSMEYSSLLMQWRTACALEKQSGDTGSGDGSQPEWTKVTGMSQDPGAGQNPEDAPTLGSVQLTPDDLDQSGFGMGGGGSCIGIVSAGGSELTSGFMATFASPPAMFCNFIGWIYAITVLSAAVASVYILAKGGS